MCVGKFGDLQTGPLRVVLVKCRNRGGLATFNVAEQVLRLVAYNRHTLVAALPLEDNSFVSYPLAKFARKSKKPSKSRAFFWFGAEAGI